MMMTNDDVNDDEGSCLCESAHTAASLAVFCPAKHLGCEAEKNNLFSLFYELIENPKHLLAQGRLFYRKCFPSNWSDSSHSTHILAHEELFYRKCCPSNWSDSLSSENILKSC